MKITEELEIETSTFLFTREEKGWRVRRKPISTNDKGMQTVGFDAFLDEIVDTLSSKGSVIRATTIETDKYIFRSPDGKEWQWRSKPDGLWMGVLLANNDAVVDLIQAFLKEMRK